MQVLFSNLCQKSVVSIQDGSDFGEICDIVVDTENGRVTAIVMPGKLRFFGLLGREEDTVIPIELIKITGRDVILVDFACKSAKKRQNKGIFDRFF